MKLTKGHLSERAIILVCSWMVYATAYLLRNNLPLALPSIEAELHLPRTSLGLLSSAFLWTYGLGHLINGPLGDRHSARKLILLGLGLSALANAVFSMVQDFWAMMLCWGVNGWFQAMLWGPIAKTVAAWYGPQEGGAAVMRVSTSMAAGALLSMLLSGALASVGSWRNLFLAPALIAVIPLFLHLRVFRDGPAEALSHTRASPPDRQLPPLSVILKRRQVRFVAFACICQGIVRDGISLWAATFFMETYSLDVTHAVLYMLLLPVSSFMGILIVTRIYRKTRVKLTRLAALSFLAGTLMTGVLALAWRAGAVVAMLCLALASGAMSMANTLLLGVYPLRFVHDGRVSGVAGFLDFTSYLAAGSTAALSGLLLDRLGWTSMLILWLSITTLGAFSLFSAERV